LSILHLNATPVRLDDSLTDRQAQTAAALPIGCAGTIKLFEYMGQFILWNTNPSIRNSNLSAFAASTRTDVNRRIGLGIFDSVIKQVDKHLREECEVYWNHWQVIGKIDDNLPLPKLLTQL
jgi:hypothetical protein